MRFLHVWEESQKILEEDGTRCHNIGKIGAGLISDNANILTHCNAGGLATSGYGTALAVIFTAFSQGKKLHVYVDETRPLWQGARLTTWELKEMGIPVTLICDNTAAFVM
jgi:methylthioribose-1-phosphate isomerase